MPVTITKAHLQTWSQALIAEAQKRAEDVLKHPPIEYMRGPIEVAQAYVRATSEALGGLMNTITVRHELWSAFRDADKELFQIQHRLHEHFMATFPKKESA